MAVSFPYLLSFRSDFLRASSSTPGIQRNDEMSGSGQLWVAELATPARTFTLPHGGR